MKTQNLKWWLLQEVEGLMEWECKRFIRVTARKMKGRSGAGASGEKLQIEFRSDACERRVRTFQRKRTKRRAIHASLLGLPRWFSGKESACQCRRCGVHPWAGKIPQRRKWQLAPVFLPGKIPWTEEPGRLQSMELQKSWTWLSY